MASRIPGQPYRIFQKQWWIGHSWCRSTAGAKTKPGNAAPQVGDSTRGRQAMKIWMWRLSQMDPSHLHSRGPDRRERRSSNRLTRTKSHRNYLGKASDKDLNLAGIDSAADDRDVREEETWAGRDTSSGMLSYGKTIASNYSSGVTEPMSSYHLPIPGIATT
ncbi:hypothetical protein C8R48DRAFT_667728 [Suillus tomentosus]|nr:hypothetical protein C8R48DRAFT_667728 [Suillus tomentosus]